MMRESLSKVSVKGSSKGYTDGSTQEPALHFTEHFAEGFIAGSPRKSTEGSAADTPEGCDVETCSTLVFFVNGKRVRTVFCPILLL